MWVILRPNLPLLLKISRGSYESYVSDLSEDSSKGLLSTGFTIIYISHRPFPLNTNNSKLSLNKLSSWVTRRTWFRIRLSIPSPEYLGIPVNILDLSFMRRPSSWDTWHRYPLKIISSSRCIDALCTLNIMAKNSVPQETSRKMSHYE